MRTFRATTLQDASNLPWACQTPPETDCIPVWGVNIVPWPVYGSWQEGEEGSLLPVGEPLYYEWKGILDPADTPLPSWITEVVEDVEEPTPISDPSADSPGLLTKLKSAIGF
jgi:hypothetical protein